MNIRTVASLTKEAMFVDEYKRFIYAPYQYVLYTLLNDNCIIHSIIITILCLDIYIPSM